MCKDLLARLLKPLREVSLMAGVNLPGESGQVGLTSEMSLAADGVDEDNQEDKSFPKRVSDEEGTVCMCSMNLYFYDQYSYTTLRLSCCLVPVCMSDLPTLCMYVCMYVCMCMHAVDRNSIRRLKEAERAGKANAKLRNKTKGKTNRELRKLQREYADPALALFPGRYYESTFVLRVCNFASNMKSVISELLHRWTAAR